MEKEFEISASVQTKVKDRQWVKKQLSEGKIAQEILEFSDQTMDKFYLAAFELYQLNHFSDAADAFLFLVALNPHHYDYWLGLGAATQRCGDYEAAIDAYEMAAICQIENPIPYFHLAKCLFAMHDRESALQAIEMALEYSKDNDDFTEVYEHALAAKALLLKEQ